MEGEHPRPLAGSQREAFSFPPDPGDAPGDVPERIGDYEVDRVVARGAHGVVYKATDGHGLKVAIKWLKRRQDEKELDTVVRLSKTVKGMPPILSSGVADNRTYFVMPYYERRSLRFRLRGLSFPQPLPEIIRLANSFTEVLGELHRHGYTHCDFKPDNLLIEALPSATEKSEFELLRDDERLVLTDFGTTRSKDNEVFLGDGTPGYAAPELLTTIVDHDPRVDVYAASATLVECITGVVPFQVRWQTDQAFDDEVLHRTGLLESTLRKGLDHDPRYRHESMPEWFDALHKAADHLGRFPLNDSALQGAAVSPEPDRSGRERSETGGRLIEKFASSMGPVVATTAVAIALYWGLTQMAARPELLDLSAADAPQSDETQSPDGTASAPSNGESNDEPDNIETDPTTVGQIEISEEIVTPGAVAVGPALLDRTADSEWGTLRRRVTAAKHEGETYRARFHHVQDGTRAVVSPDERWILARRESWWTIVDRATGEYRNAEFGGDSEPTWLTSEPATVLHLAESSLMLLAKTVDGVTSVAADLTDRVTTEIPGAAYLQAPGYGEPDHDGSMFAWAVFNSDDDLEGFVTYDLLSDTVIGLKVGPPEGVEGRFHSTAMAKSGDRVVVAYEHSSVVYDNDFTNEWLIEQRPASYELALNAAGEDVIIGANFDTGTFGTGWIVAHNLNVRQSSKLLELYDNANANVTFSGLAAENPGWVLASTHDCGVPGSWSCDRIMALNVDSGSIINIAHTENCAESAFAAPLGVVNKDFTRAWFNTDFGTCGEDASIVELDIDVFTN